jgi:hypothetical protein
MFKKTPSAAPGRPTATTPYGVKFTDTPAYSRYAELLRIRDWHKSFLDDMDHLRLDGPAAVERIEDFIASLSAEHRGSTVEHLERVSACLRGTSTAPLSVQLLGLRMTSQNHWAFCVSSAAQECESVPTGQEIAYDGPFPRKAGDQTPAYGYQRAMASGRL